MGLLENFQTPEKLVSQYLYEIYTCSMKFYMFILWIQIMGIIILYKNNLYVLG